MTKYGAIGEESSYSTAVSYTKYFPIIKETMTVNNNFLQSETTESQYITKQRIGKFTVEGSFDIPIEPENCGLLIKGMLPTVTNAAQSGTTVLHTFKPAIASYPSFTLGIGTNVTAGEKKITSAMFTKMSFAASNNQLHTGTWNYFGETLELAALSSPSYSTLSPFAYHESPVEIATVADGNVEAITIDIMKDRYKDAGVLGSRFHPRNSSVGRTTVSGTMDISFEALTQFQRFLGTASSTTPETQSYTTHAIELLTTGIGTGDTTDKYKFNVIVPKAVFDTTKADIDNASRTIQNLTWHGIYDTSAACPVYVELQNQVASY